MKNSKLTFQNLTIRTMQDLIDAVDTFGILPFFSNSIEGFSIEEHTPADIWFTDVPGPWEWKGPVIRQTNCAYGKFLEKKAVYISKEWFPDFANYRRDGYDFDARFDDELASFKDKAMFDLLDENAPVMSYELKKKGNYRKDGNKGFDTIMNRLQAQCYVIISDFQYLKDKEGKEYGWGVAQYSTPEKFMGDAFTSQVYARSPEESYLRIVDHLCEILPDTPREQIERFLARGGAATPSAGTRNWLIPSNPKYYDIITAFSQSDEHYWHQGNDNMQPGDSLYIYVGAPYSAILYKCLITETGIPPVDDEDRRWKSLIKLRVLEKYDKSLLGRQTLRQYDIVSVRGARYMPIELIRDIENHSLAK